MKNKGFIGTGILITAIIALIVGGGVVYFITKTDNPKGDNLVLEISNFEECVKAGYPIMESYPRQCKTGDGENFVEVIEEKITDNQTTNQENNSTQANNQPSENNITANSNNVLNQPAYLINAYTKNNKNYIDVDYIQILSGMASLQAQVADGSCPNVNDCYDFPNGYKQNTNPLIRTFEVSPNVVIMSSWDPYPNTNQITFQQFKNSQSWDLIQTNPPFQPAKGPYIRIDVQNNLVVKITRPYQE